MTTTAIAFPRGDARPRRAPADAAVRTVLRDGGIASLRPLRRGETGPLLEVFSAMSERSRYLRYLVGMPRMPEAMVSALADVDGHRHVAWVASVAERPVGVARYIRDVDALRAAELAFEVADDQHGRGLATVLLDTVTTVASVNGVRELRASVLPENTASRRLLTRLGGVARFEDGLLEVEGPLGLLQPAVVDRAAVVRLACGVADCETYGVRAP